MTGGNEKPIAKFQGLKLYEDRVEIDRLRQSFADRRAGGGGPLRGATAHVDSRGRRDRAVIVISGPDVSIARRVNSKSSLVWAAAERFVAQVNRAAAKLEETG